MRTQSLLLLAVCAVALILYGCAELKDSPPAAVDPGIAVHPPGFSEPSSPNFHGRDIQARNWDMQQCRTCHGQTYAGGAVGVSCRTCHAQGAGPENCTTCHGGTNAAPPQDLSGNRAITARGVGAHQIHLVGPRDLSSTTVACSDCHRVPATVYEPGHLDSPSPAEVTLSSPFARNPSGGMTPSPAYDPTSQKCSNTYCHGAFRLPKTGTNYSFVYTDTATAMVGANFAPIWNAGPPQSACGTCHSSVTPEGPSFVPAGHRFSDISGCAPCHAGVIDASGKITDPSKHMNGKINAFGDEYDFR